MTFSELTSLAPKTLRLIAWINGHDLGVTPVIRATDETLTVQCIEYHSDTKTRLVIRETIPATMQAARDWLGY